jgi:hypothetical protein
MNFAEQEKAKQRAWAERQPGMVELLDNRHGTKTWVLREDSAAHNAYRREWWRQVARRAHRWGRALNSSQAFALNLFGPALNPAVARAVWRAFSSRPLPLGADVVLSFEFDYATDGRERYPGIALGERRQRTQIDVLLELRAPTECGALLIEVKYTEAEFGTCRGARKGDPNCSDLRGLTRDPELCWLSRHEGRKYWSLMTTENASFRFSETSGLGCPFQRDLYQLMRNRVLADAMRQAGGLEWADTGVCIHPRNVELRNSFGSDVIGDGFSAAFSSVSRANIELLDAVKIADAFAASSPMLGEWRKYIRERYEI